MDIEIVGGLSQEAETKIVLLVLDGLGGLPQTGGGSTELESAHTPNLDHLASMGTCGLIEPVWPGITPGSGAGPLSLFGYDPLKFTVGRGVLSALGIGFDLQPHDVAARGNFCTVDEDGRVLDRRAGRISTEKNSELCEKLRETEVEGVDLIIKPVKEHRFLLVLRNEELTPDLPDTDPQTTGVEPLRPEPCTKEARKTAGVVGRFLEQVRERLADEDRANMVLLRGFGQLPDWPRFPDTFNLRAAAIADYPMYRGISRLVGIEVPGNEPGLEGHVEAMQAHWEDFDFFCVHEKQFDSAGEDGDFDRRVGLLEEADGHVPDLLELEPDVLIVTGDHSTPATLKQHSWHPVPVLLWSETARPDGVERFSEKQCRGGGFDPTMPAENLMPLALAHAMRLQKFGA